MKEKKKNWNILKADGGKIWLAIETDVYCQRKNLIGYIKRCVLPAKKSDWLYQQMYTASGEIWFWLMKQIYIENWGQRNLIAYWNRNLLKTNGEEIWLAVETDMYIY